MSLSYHFFSCADSRQTIWLGNGRGVKFVDIGNSAGLYSTNNPDEVAELRSLIQRGKGGITELSYEDYLNLKKNRSSTKRWRDEVDNKELQRKAHLRTSGESPAAPAVTAEPAPPVVPMPEPGARPRPRAAAAPPPPPRA